MTIAFRAGSTVNNTSSSSAVLNKPAGTADGDVLIVAIAYNTGMTISPPAGWTHLYGQSSAQAQKMDTYYKVAASEGASWTWTFTGGPGGNSGVVVGYSGCNATPVDTSAQGTDATNPTTSLIAPTVTPTKATDMLVCLVNSVSGASSPTFTAPTGMTLRTNVTGASTYVIGTAELQLASSSATGTETFTVSQNVSGSNGVSVLLVGVITNTKTLAVTSTGSMSLVRSIGKIFPVTSTGTPTITPNSIWSKVLSVTGTATASWVGGFTSAFGKRLGFRMGAGTVTPGTSMKGGYVTPSTHMQGGPGTGGP